MSMPKDIHRVITYNVLSSHLSGEDHFCHCKKEDLLPKTRYHRVVSKLEKEIKKDSIICLQEVSHDWSGELAAFFQQNNYFFFTGLYGKPFNGNMGVAMAFPNKKYSLTEMNMKRLSYTKRWPAPPESGMIVKLFQKLWSILVAPYRKVTGYKPPRDPWDLAKWRNNIFLFARLESSVGNSICVGTYHMPCMFRDPQVMTIHTALAAQRMQNLCGEDPYILCGDFNFKPDSAQYQLMTTGFLEEGHPEQPEVKEHDEWRPVLQALKSAYATFHGKEPSYTNNAQIADHPPFVETLDYLFHTDDLQIINTVSLEYLKNVKGPFPIDSEPSDHVLIGAEFQQKTEATMNMEKWKAV